jgi:sugar lactone lactonase YvrE
MFTYPIGFLKTQAPAGPSWTLTGMTYTGDSFATTGQATDVFGGFFKPDGTKMYVVDLDAGDVSNSVYEYNLGTAWDITTASYSGNSFSFTAQDVSPSGLSFSPDGTKMYMCGGQNDDLREYDLSTAWNVSTASDSGNGISSSLQDSSAQDVQIGNSGNSIYMSGATNDQVYQYDLGSPYSLAVPSFTGKQFDVSGQTGVPFGIFFKSDGTKLFVCDNQNVFQYTIGTAWQIPTTTYDSITLDLSPQLTDNRGLYFRPDGTRMYVFGTTAVYEYSL